MFDAKVSELSTGDSSKMSLTGIILSQDIIIPFRCSFVKLHFSITPPDFQKTLECFQCNMYNFRDFKRYGEGRFSARWSPGEPLTRSARIGDAKQAIYNEYRQQQLHQVKLAQNISRVSPTAIYQIGCEALVGTGIKHYERFFKKAVEYRRSLLQFTYEEYPFNPNLFLEAAERQQLTELKISLDKIPKFGDTLSDFSTSFAQASLDILLLFLFNLVFFMGASLAFTRYDL